MNQVDTQTKADLDEPEHCVSVKGGKVHEVISYSDASGDVFPFCRTGASDSGGTWYQETSAELTCRTCIIYRDRRRA